jgi:hypothetical protein
MTDQPTIPTITALDEALQAYREADYRLREAQTDRDTALNTVLSLVPDRAEEGTTRCDTAYFKASITSKLNRTPDKSAVAALKADHPELYALVFNEAPSLDLKTLRALELADDPRYALVAQTLIVKPGKPVLKVEVAQ